MQTISNHIKNLFKHELISGASMILIGSLLSNLLNFFFNLFMVRNLSEADYGILASLVSLISLATLPAGATVPTLVHFGAIYFAKEETHLLRGLFFKVTKLLFILGIAIFTIFVFFTQQLKEFFRIEDGFLIILAGTSIFIGFMQVVNVALIQAKLSFTFLTFISLMGSMLKLFLGVLLVLFHFAVRGGLSAYFFAGIIPYVISFIPLRFVFEKGVSQSKLPIRTILAYAAPSAITLFSLTSFITTDIILVKHFFNPTDAGIYSALSLVGRVIFYFSAPITTVMFPLIVQKHSRDEKFHNTFKLSLLLVFLPSLILTALYFLLPQFTVGFFTRKESVLNLAPSYLWLFGVFVTLYSASYVMVNFFLAVKKTAIFIPVMMFALLQAIGIWIYHTSFREVIVISITSVGLLLFSLLLYYWKLYVKKSS